ncbi:hypothetical protein LR48_Vigan07g272600 [Vigna angularis]|uniref:FMR1-interacting protein 1 conserved domain-containing protein n=1 Tax=Phaseolus angularis TaxID=3914 RepID=A0A0L9V2F1_PHAAN|nr:uncharacterized protein LOC108338108 isoform X2 [Vigna angularis]KAG2390602.1 uncharacterized protein HKW66_Vig0219920 [Vigna angularis]KOM49022.1 hypothetical protein LR48_Vigan07g272600 [Vigna angularis]
MANNCNSSSKTQPPYAPSPNHQNFLQNNGVGMTPQPQFCSGNHQSQSLLPPFMQPILMNAAPFMNAANHNHFPLQNNQMHLPQMGMPGHQQGQPLVGGLGPQNSGGNPNYSNSMYPVQGQVMQNAAQLNLSQLQRQMLAQSILNMLQPSHMNISMPNGQFCAPYPVQNMNQQLPTQMPSPSQGIPHGMHPGSCPMFGFPNQRPQAMVPQNSLFSASPQLGFEPGGQVRLQIDPNIDPNEKNLAPPNVNANALVSRLPFSSQQLQGNTSGSLNSNLAHTSNSQPPAFLKSHSQENPYGNIKTNVPNTNWNGSPSKNFKNRPKRGGFKGGFQKSKFHDANNGRTGFPKDHNGRGPYSGRAGQDRLRSKELKQQPERFFSVTYTEQEIQQWREARKNNHPCNHLQKRHSECPMDSKVINREVLQRELKEVLAKQAELGIEVAEIPSHYLKNSENRGLQNEGKNKFSDKRKFQNKFNEKLDRKGRFGKRQKFANNISESPLSKKRKPTLLQKLLSADISKDKSHLFQVFRFMVINSFFKHCPDKPLRYPSVMVKENGSEVDTEKDVSKRGNEGAVKKIVSLNNDDDHNSEDEDSDVDENDSIVHNHPHEELFSLVKEEQFEKSDEEEGEILE